ncbi:discoidin domain-containing protein [Parapedobacter sp. 10938]|uniref:discoidin domain-containing protein n=1 Tax=Parapedobacter flavus TaxID=3110225 RepID=UPI002DB89223|nr:discoidin domain-containing protein [Parapedobacter sp. 10938]MEC3881481.1 discoidin domain-containing protein [Parapedobacter sp. 10938]
MKHILTLTASILCGVFILNSCSEPYAESIELERFMLLSLSGAADSPIEQTVSLDDPFTYPLSVSYGGTTNYDQGDISVNLGVDNALVDGYNADHSTAYLPLPEGSWSLDKTAIVIPDGDRISDVATVTVDPSLVNFAHDYLLPVTMQSATGDKIPINEELKTVYLVIKGDVELLPVENLWTAHGSSSVWQEGFKVENVYDGNRNSYWHSALTGMPQWFAVNMNGYKLVEGFSWINRQEPDQHALPKHVKFETSMDGEIWTEVLDVPELPASRTMQVLELPEKVVAKYFKVTVLSNWADAPYTYVADVSTWAGTKPTGEYDWEKSTWEVIDYKSQWNDGMGVSKIFDGDKNSAWHSEPFDATKNGMPQWFVVDMMKVRPAIKGFLIWNRQDDHGSEPKHVVFSVSEDNTNWTTVLELDEMSNDFSKELDYKTTTPQAGRYLKVEVLSNWSGGAWTYFGEITTY